MFFNRCWTQSACEMEWVDPNPDPENTVTYKDVIVASDYLAPRDVQGDANTMYWADDNGIRRSTG